MRLLAYGTSELELDGTPSTPGPILSSEWTHQHSPSKTDPRSKLEVRSAPVGPISMHGVQFFRFGAEVRRLADENELFNENKTYGKRI